MPVNPAVQRCANAYNQTFSLERGKGANGYNSQKVARASYLSLMSDVADHDSICDFIACVTYAMLHGLLHEPHGPKLLAAAKLPSAPCAQRTNCRNRPRHNPQPITFFLNLYFFQSLRNSLHPYNMNKIK